MRAEARALRRGSDHLTVLHTGTGPARAATASATLARGGAVVVAGIGGGLAPGLRTGDVVVATEVRAGDGSGQPIALPGAEALADLMRRHGMTVRTGPLVSARRIVHGAARDRLAATGASIVDTESYWLLANLTKPADPADPAAPANLVGWPVWCVRVVADSAAARVFTPATLRAVRVALRRLPGVGAALAEFTRHEFSAREVRADGGTAAAGR
jgi:4-hydroxy-3-methylbut-2-enyl diphosphate reductase